MKNLRKVLAVVLVVAMAFSFAAVASASFTDASSIKYTEAVDVLTGIGVLAGTDQGTYDPTGSLTREQAAKIIAYMLLGPTNAQLISNATSQKFSDVKADRWSAGYIEYCANLGIIVGVGDGTFQPTGVLTTAAFTKMLLVALGYNADAEGIKGTSWAINTASLAVVAGVYDSNIAISSITCTREQAAQLALKALMATKVQYTGGTTITIGDSTITTGAVRSFVANGSVANPVTQTITNDYFMQFAEQHFTQLVYTASTSDSFGRPAHSWTNKGVPVGMYKNTPVITYNSAKLASAVAGDLAGYSLADNTAAPNTVYYAVDNITSVTYTGAAGVNVSNGAAAAISPAAATTAATLAALTGDGKLVEIYADSSKHITKVVVVGYTVGTISNIVTTSDRTTYTITGGVGGSFVDYVSPTVADSITGHTGMTKGTTITYVTVAGKAYVYPTTMVTGPATSYTEMYTVPYSITVNGTIYPIGNDVTNVSSFGVNATSANYFIDQFGFVVKTSSVAASTNYVNVLNSFGTVTTNVNGSVPSVQVMVQKADGTVAALDVALTKVLTGANAGDYTITGLGTTIYDFSAGTTAAQCDTLVDAALLGNVFGYTLNETTITLQALTAVPGAGPATMTPGQVYNDTVSDIDYAKTSEPGDAAGGETVLFSTSTVYVFSFTNGTTAVYTGPYGLPTAATNLPGNVVMTANSATVGTASYVFISGVTAFGAVASTNYVYVDNNVFSTSINSVGTTVYTYTGTKADGTTISLNNVGAMLTDSGVYVPNADNTIADGNIKNKATDVGVTNTFYVYDAALAVTGSLLEVGGNYYNITSDTKTVFIDPTKGDVDGNEGFVVLAATSAGAASNNVATIYIIG